MKMCDRCGKNPAQEMHPCPFSEEVHGDSETLCDCCEECEGSCADDV